MGVLLNLFYSLSSNRNSCSLTFCFFEITIYIFDFVCNKTRSVFQQYSFFKSKCIFFFFLCFFSVWDGQINLHFTIYGVEKSKTRTPFGFNYVPTRRIIIVRVTVSFSFIPVGQERGWKGIRAIRRSNALDTTFLSISPPPPPPPPPAQSRCSLSF